ncbi:glycosyltransferase family 4 protein [Yoonia sp.]|uniref:glycosyltransferase family 4 protein n=1 Tax=Yoonia sp. TaxID=2212373 RepID=UPI00358E1F85
MNRPTVTIVQRRLTHYRVPLFVALRERLDRHDIHLRLLHGTCTSAEAAKNDAGHIDWAEPLATRYLAGDRLCWQPFARKTSGSSLVIITQENAMLANQLALIRKPSPKLAFWGHGANLQGNRNSLRETYKRWSTRQVDWYFAYTSRSVDLVRASGVPLEKITNLNNAIDMSGLERDLAALPATELEDLRLKLGLRRAPVGLFLGSLYRHKRLDFLLAAAHQIRASVTDFQLLVVGDGPERPLVEAAAAQHPWIHFMGSRKGPEKASILKLASINLNPGLVGLGILDSFAAGVPMVTTDCGLHSPEIAYLSTDNGIMTPDALDSYVAACIRLLTNKEEYAQLTDGCRAAAHKYTLPSMVENFSNGILQALETHQ